jgi:hypothetical protein
MIMNRERSAVMTIGELMLAVAAIGLVCWLETAAPDRVFFGSLPFLIMVVPLGYRRTKPAGYRPSPSERILVGLMGLAAIAPVFALRMVTHMGSEPIRLSDRVSLFFGLVVAGTFPLVVFVLSGLLSRAVRVPRPARTGSGELVAPGKLSGLVIDESHVYSAETGRLRHSDRYETVMASDVARDGMYLELWERHPSRELVLCVFYSDIDGSFEFERYRADIPPEVEAWFHQEAKRRLPPVC